MRQFLLFALAATLTAQTLNYTYDSAGRLTGVAYPNGKSLTYSYDAAGNLLKRVVTTPGAVPAPTGVTPGAGSGLTQTLTITYSDTGGWQNLTVVDALINNFLDGRQACYVAFVPSGANSGSVFLVDNAGDAGGPYTGFVLPGSGSASNNQCSVAGTGSSVSGSGNTLTLTLVITFTAAFAGNKIVYLAAQDASSNSGWQALGTWGVPGAATFPTATGVTPARTTGSGQAYTFTFGDTKGSGDLGVVNMLINNFLDGRQACYLAYSRPFSVLYLVNDSGTGLSPGLTLGGSGTIGNSQCTVASAGSSASGAGNVLTVVLNISFTAAFNGNRVIYLAARDSTDANNSGWQALGSVTVQGQ